MPLEYTLTLICHFSLIMAWCQHGKIFHSFTFKLFVSLHLKHNFLQAVYNWVLLFIQCDNLSLLTGAFRPFIIRLLVWLDLNPPSCYLFSIILVVALGFRVNIFKLSVYLQVILYYFMHKNFIIVYLRFLPSWLLCYCYYTFTNTCYHHLYNTMLLSLFIQSIIFVET